MKPETTKNWNIALAALSFFMVAISIVGAILAGVQYSDVLAQMAEDSGPAVLVVILFGGLSLLMYWTFCIIFMLLTALAGIAAGVLHTISLKKPKLSRVASIVGGAMSALNLLSLVGFYLVGRTAQGQMLAAFITLSALIVVYAILRVVYAIVFAVMRKREKKAAPAE